MGKVLSICAVPSFAVQSIARSFALTGGNLEGVLTAAGLPTDLLLNAPRHVDLANELALLERATNETKDPLFAVQCGLDFKSRSTTLTSFVVHNSRTLEDAINNVILFARLARPLAGFEPTHTSDELVLSVAPKIGALRTHPEHSEFMISALVANFAEMTTEFPIKRVGFAHSLPSARVDALSERLGVRVTMACSNAQVVFDKARLADRIVAADVTLLPHLTDYAQRLLKELPRDFAPTSQRVRDLIQDKLEDQTHSIETVADELGMSVSTLNRRLRKEGSSFSGIVTDTRKSLARELLADGSQSLSEIAYHLGYSDQSAFTTAYRRWTGQSPGRFRDTMFGHHRV